MSESRIQTLDVSFIPNRNADESVYTIGVFNGDKDESTVAYVHLDKSGCYNLYESMYHFIEGALNGDIRMRKQSFASEEDLNYYLTNKY